MSTQPEATFEGLVFRGLAPNVGGEKLSAEMRQAGINVELLFNQHFAYHAKDDGDIIVFPFSGTSYQAGGPQHELLALFMASWGKMHCQFLSDYKQALDEDEEDDEEQDEQEVDEDEQEVDEEDEPEPKLNFNDPDFIRSRVSIHGKGYIARETSTRPREEAEEAAHCGAVVVTNKKGKH